MTDITISDVTDGEVTGQGSFDLMIAASTKHLKKEYEAGRIDGDEYATVYLGIVQSAMAQSIQFELQRHLQVAQAKLLTQQTENAVKEGLGIEANTALTEARTLTETSNKELVDAQVVTQGLQQQDIVASTQVKVSQKAQIEAETLNVPKQGIVLDKQADKLTSDIALTEQQKLNLTAEALNIPKQGVLLDNQATQVVSETNLVDEKIVSEGVNQNVATAQAALVSQQKTNLVAEGLNIPKQGAVLDKQVDKLTSDISLTDQQKTNLVSEKALTDEKVTSEGINQTVTTAQASLITQQKTNLIAEALNIPKQGTILTNQAAKLVADKDLTTQQKLNLVSEELKIDAETSLITQNRSNAVTQNTVLTSQKSKLDSEKSLLDQKKVTEEAQTKDTAGGSTVAGSIGKQKLLYAAQTEGFTRDAEQKASKILADAFAVTKSADATSLVPISLDAVSINAVIDRLKAGIGVTT